MEGGSEGAAIQYTQPLASRWRVREGERREGRRIASPKSVKEVTAEAALVRDTMSCQRIDIHIGDFLCDTMGTWGNYPRIDNVIHILNPKNSAMLDLACSLST